MSNENVPDREESEFVYEDKPYLITLLIGGMFISILVFFILSFALRTLPISELQIIPWIVSIGLMISTVTSGMKSDVVIRINTKTGWIYARDNTKYWEGYATDLDKFEVLQREEILPNGDPYTRYKIYLKLSDESFYEIPVSIGEVRGAIENVEKAKKAIPKGKSNSDVLLKRES